MYFYNLWLDDILKKLENNTQIRIGEFLVSKNLISTQQLERALEIQRSQENKSLIGEILRSENYINHLNFYQQFAEYKGLQFVDLSSIKIPQNLASQINIEDCLELNFIPFEYIASEKKYKIATTDINQELTEFLNSKFENYQLFITSPLDINRTINSNFTTQLNNESTEKLYLEHPQNSAKKLFASNPVKFFTLLFLALFVGLLFDADNFLIFAWAINIFYSTTIISKLYFITTGVIAAKKINKKNNKFEELKTLPVYSILVPLYKEKENTLSKLIISISELDYQKERLDVKLIVEEDDKVTFETLKKLRPPQYFEIIKVPFSHPRTKPKACNYALKFCKGDYITIYDAEDCPDPSQLKKALQIYQQDTEGKIGAVQAKLTYYNRDENLLTQFFTIEYHSWFDMMLYGLHSNNFPIPLGGTSNHFRAETLRKLNNWDPYNVTEDADLGVRLYFNDYQTALIDSYTYEEATVNLKQWLKQRVRWVKGYIQTFLVYSRSFSHNLKKFGVKKYLGFFYFVAAPAIVFFTAPIVTIYGLFHYFTSSAISPALQQFGILNLAISIVVHMVLALYIALKNCWYKKIFASLLFGFYWFLHCIAGPIAVMELIFKPHHWNKTEHGKSKFTK